LGELKPLAGDSFPVSLRIVANLKAIYERERSTTEANKKRLPRYPEGHWQGAWRKGAGRTSK